MNPPIDDLMLELELDLAATSPLNWCDLVLEVLGSPDRALGDIWFYPFGLSVVIMGKARGVWVDHLEGTAGSAVDLVRRFRQVRGRAVTEQQADMWLRQWVQHRDRMRSVVEAERARRHMRTDEPLH